MTKIEVKYIVLNNIRKYNEMLADDIDLSVIDKIYDNFENRVCKNCKYGYAADGIDGDVYICSISRELFGYDDMVMPIDFGCNRFEREENENL